MNTIASFPISNTIITRYKTQGYIKLKEVFSREELTVFEKKSGCNCIKRKNKFTPSGRTKHVW